MARLVVWKKVWIELGGRTVTGSYAIEHDMVKVKTAAGGEKATQKGNSSAVVIARILLRELANAGEA